MEIIIKDIADGIAGQGKAEAPLKLINNRLIVEAKRMLKSKPMLVKERAYELGFDDDSYFVKFFKRQTGMLPSEFREMEQRNH